MGQSCWSHKNLEGLGFCLRLLPVFRELPEDRASAYLLCRVEGTPRAFEMLILHTILYVPQMEVSNSK